MHSSFSKIVFAAALLGAASPALAQTNGSNSPYSRYGFGLLGDGANAFNKGMAGTAYGMRDGRSLNTKNPASYSAIDSLSFLFDIGLTLQNGNLDQDGRKVNAKNTSVDYVTAGFRVAPKLGVSLGLVPYSTVGYSLSNESSFDTPTGEVTQTGAYQGDGGLHEAYLGVGWEPVKNLSAGVNLGYLWGDITHTTMVSFSNTNISSNRQVYETDVRSYKASFGLQYVFPLAKGNSLTLGATYHLGHDINSNAYYYNQRVESGNVTSGDSVTAKDAFALPHTFGVGLAWTQGGRWRIGADYTYARWSDVKFPALSSGNDYRAEKGLFDDRHEVNLGFEYMGKPEGIRWRDHVRYRAGLSFATPYAKVDGREGPRSYKAALGVSLPIINMHNNRTFVNISAQYERVEPQVAGMIKENYLRLCIGLSFNERWFMKWKAQ